MSALATMLHATHKRLALDAQLGDIDVRATNTVGYRAYYDGDHVLQLTDEQRSMLRIIDRGFGGEGFNSNYMARVVNTKADRLVVDRIETDDQTATEKLSELVKLVRIDRINVEVHRHTIRDADNFVMVSFDNELKIPVITEELAYDGVTGVIPVYRSEVDPTPYCVIKIWNEYNLQEIEGDTYEAFTRLNLYFADRIEKWQYKNGAVSKFYDTAQEQNANQWPIRWTDPATGQPLGIPIFHFKWNPEKNFGKSVLDDVIPVQDGFNRVLNSLVMASELTAFRLLAAIGFEPPSEMTPGGWITVGEDGLTKDDVVDIKNIEAGDLKSLLESARFFKGEIHDSTNTPNPAGIDAAASGEARKQYESFLVGELETFQKQAGEVWERVFSMAVKLWRVFGLEVVPDYKQLYTRWKPVAVRDDAILMANAVAVRPEISQNAFLQIVAPIFEWNQAKIETIIEEKTADDKAKLEQMRSALPDFGTATNVDDTNADPTAVGANNFGGSNSP